MKTLKTFTVSELLAQLKALNPEAGSTAIRFAIEPAIIAGSVELKECAPMALPGCGCWYGVEFDIEAFGEEGKTAKKSPLLASALIERLTLLQKEIGCNGTRIGSHNLPSSVWFNLVNPDLDYALDLVEILRNDDGIVFRLEATED